MKIAITSRKYFKLVERKRQWIRAYPSAPHDSWEHEAELVAELARLRVPVEAALKEANGKAREHAIHSWEQVVTLAMEIEKKLEDDGVTLKNRPGTTLSYIPAGPWAKAYNYSAATTGIIIKRFSADWYLINVQQTWVWPKQHAYRKLDISRQAGANITKQALKGYTVGAAEAQREAHKKYQELIESISAEDGE